MIGVQWSPTSFTPRASASGLAADPALSSADLANNFSATWDTTSLATGLYTLRLRVTDNLGNKDRRAVWVRHPDPQDQPGFPRRFDGSLETLSVALATPGVSVVASARMAGRKHGSASCTSSKRTIARRGSRLFAPRGASASVGAHRRTRSPDSGPAWESANPGIRPEQVGVQRACYR